MKNFILSFILYFSGLALYAQNTISSTIQHGGMTREYRIYVPATYNPNKPAPLVFNLHGYTSNNLQQEFYGDFRPIADSAGFLLVHPNGTLDNGGNRYWNVGFFPSPIDDVDFILKLIDSLAKDYNINQNRIYSTGLSNGGFMSYKLACETQRFAAIAPVAGSMTAASFVQCTPTKPTPVMVIHGTADGTVPYLGTTSFLHVDSLVKFWVKFNHCDMNPIVSNVPNTNVGDGATTERYLYPNGDNATSVELYKILNGGHTWAGAPITIGTTCMDFSASKEIWRFFNQYSLTTDIENKANLISFSLFPNPANENIFVDFGADVSAEIEVRDMQAKILKTTHLEGNTSMINVADLPQGVYHIRVKVGNKEGYKLFIK